MKIVFKVWRQKSKSQNGNFIEYPMDNISEDMSLFEAMDLLNNNLVKQGADTIAFDHDCREGICGTCGIFINGRAHGPLRGVTACQVHMRSFKDGETIVLEPWRGGPFEVIKDLVVDRTSLDRIMMSGGYISVNTGAAAEANATPIPKSNADEAFDAAACIGCGACVATCKNSSAMLFVAAKVSQLALLQQGQIERTHRVINMVAQMDEEKFGSCTNTGACEVECPKEISITHIARLNREYIKATF